MQYSHSSVDGEKAGNLGMEMSMRVVGRSSL